MWFFEKLQEALLFSTDIHLDSRKLYLQPLEFLLRLNDEIHNFANININANLHTVSFLLRMG
jgi:hypothetical protein